jgi:hypothetical protein
MGFVCRNLPNVIQSVCSRWLTPMHIVFTLHITCSSHLPYTHTAHTSWFRNKTLVAAAGAQCAQPALAPGLSCSNLAPTGKYPMVCPLDPKGAGGAGDFCVCSETGHAGVCVPVPGVPEQINLQVWKTSPPCAKPCGIQHRSYRATWLWECVLVCPTMRPTLCGAPPFVCVHATWLCTLFLTTRTCCSGRLVLGTYDMYASCWPQNRIESSVVLIIVLLALAQHRHLSARHSSISTFSTSVHSLLMLSS